LVGIEDLMWRDPDWLRKLMYESWISKQIFDFKLDWYKSMVVDKNQSYRMAGEVRLLEDINYNKRYLKPTNAISKVFWTLQNFAKNNQEWTAILNKSYKSKWAAVSLKNQWYFYQSVMDLFPWREVWEKIYFGTYTAELKKQMQNLIKEWNIKHGNLVDMVREVTEEVAGIYDWTIAKKSKINTPLKRAIAWWIEWVNSTRRAAWLSEIRFSKVKAWDKTIPKLNETYTELIENGALWARNNSVQWALDSLEWLNWYWLWLDVADYNRLKDITLWNLVEAGEWVKRAWWLLKEENIRMFMFNSYAKSMAGYKWQKLIKFLEDAERVWASMMYWYLFNPITGWQLW